MKTSADPATRISPDAGREKTPRPARSVCCATVPPPGENARRRRLTRGEFESQRQTRAAGRIATCEPVEWYEYRTGTGQREERRTRRRRDEGRGTSGGPDADGTRDEGQPVQRNRGPVDEVDREIIRLLQRDGRTSNTDIARALEVTETTIRKRIARLIDEDLVNVVAVPTPRAVGMTLSAIIGISVQLPSLQAVSERLGGYQEVRYAGGATGPPH